MYGDYESGKLKAETEFNKHKLDIIGMSEVRWNQFDEFSLPERMTFVYLGRPNEEGDNAEGIGLLLNKVDRLSDLIFEFLKTSYKYRLKSCLFNYFH